MLHSPEYTSRELSKSQVQTADWYTDGGYLNRWNVTTRSSVLTRKVLDVIIGYTSSIVHGCQRCAHHLRVVMFGN